ncbi:MAG: GH3 auxin-responsive promoter family protein [Candidatus Pacebacteria bacterium]|nr:GH3 auxin-responsive promoter family protein [Candidatus Paceibacterota bacterium]
MKNIIETSMKTYFRMRKYKVESFKKNQLVSQEFILHDLLFKAKGTEYGKYYDFENIMTYEQFQKNVPLVRYEDIEPYISKMLKGQQDILWPGLMHHFSKSSGTTNDVSKYLPVSHDSLYKNNYMAGRDLYTIYFGNYPDSDLFDNKGSMLSLGGSFEVNDHGMKVGDVSAILMSEAPKWAENYREPRLDVALLSEWKDKIPAIINDTLEKNITHLSGVPTWFVSLFEEIKKEKPFTTLRDIWPNLELFIHGAVAFGPYRKIFNDLLPFDDMKYMEVYNASEGFFAIQDNSKKLGEMLLLTDHGVFYEFIDMDTYGHDTQNICTLAEVELGKDYAIIITTNAGLWRYDLGDTVCFTSKDPYRIKISGRTKHFINVFGEELMVGNTDEAIQVVSEQHNVVIKHYTAGPVFMNTEGKGGHEWIIEFEEEPEDLNGFIQDLDTTLQDLNSDYKAKRQDDIALQLLKLHSVPEGTFINWMEQRGKLGGQHKIPKLSNKRNYLEQIFEILK